MMTLLINKQIVFLYKSKRKRASLSASQGSISLEAAITTTMFLMLVLFVMNFMVIQGQIFERQIFLDSTVKQLAKMAYYLDVADRITDQNETLKEEKEQIKERINRIEEMGISVTDSFYKNGMVDMKLNYTVDTVFWKYKIEILQRAQMRDWRGVDLCEEKKIVYITKTGTVYHRNINCSHLTRNISTVSFSEVEKKRNASGAKYYPCEKCVKSKSMATKSVYITNEGDRYHNSMKCSGLRRYIIELDEKEVGNRKPCKICGGTDG